MDAKRIRFLAISALSGFETLDKDDAVEGAVLDLLDILSDVADGPADIALVKRVEVAVRGEGFVHDRKVLEVSGV